MRDGSTLVMVEVRLRRPTLYGEGLETVALQKQRKLILTAQHYQQHEKWWGNVRFDVVSLELVRDREPVIEHIENAFDATAFSQQ
jgi:putative endonuclease